MVRRKIRALRKEELELWKKVVEQAEPLHREMPEVGEKSSLARPVVTKRPPVPQFRLGEKAKPKLPPHITAPSIREHVASQPVQMDWKQHKKMKQGRIRPEARIDLHGMTIAQAHPALGRFILDASTNGLRLVLVITGKGKTKPNTGPIPERHGVLRHQVPHWLHNAPLKQHVLQITEAHVSHGGQGAYYVYLRRSR
ncbi:MAG TPA: DNA mismatch repair protein MutS [Rhodobacterales bacterium]|nr:DNA mismatch repair protein MutS [Rhodobacterales bacterium]